MAPTKKSKKKPAMKPKMAAPKVARTRDHKTSKDPWEASRTDEEWEVDAVQGTFWTKGMKWYSVSWKAWRDKAGKAHAACTTDEPAYNLVGSAQLCKEFDSKQEEAAKKKKEADKEKAATERQKRLAEAAAVKKAAEDALLAAADANHEEVGVVDPMDVIRNAAGRPVLRMHRHKKSDMYAAYDLSKETITCLLPIDDKGNVCGCKPSNSGGTTNLWDHLYRKHRPVWLQMMKACGKLAAVGEADLKLVEEAMSQRAQDAKIMTEIPPIPARVKAVLDRISTEWIVDANMNACDANHRALKRLMSVATSGAYTGTCDRVIIKNITAMAAEGVEDCCEFIQELKADKRKPSFSSDMWSKWTISLLGMLAHGIRREGNGQPWKMVRKLAAAAPADHDRHTGEFVEAISTKAWAQIGITKPAEEIFRLKTDQGANMIKAYEKVARSNCTAHKIELPIQRYKKAKGIAETAE